MKIKYLTEREYEIMKILWGSDKPMLISDIIKLTEITAKNSVHPMLKNLIKNGYVKVVGNIVVVKTSSRLYTPAVSLEDYTVSRINEIYNKKKNWFDLKKFLLSLYEQNKNKNHELIQSVKDFIESNECN